jgi:UDP-N-acetylmuramoyl-tripeptide--D-alanyl-D-alanine ligase
LDKNADVQAHDPRDTKTGLTFKVKFEDKDMAVKMPHVIGKHNVYTILPVFPICKFFGISIENISKSLKSFKLPAGRMGLLQGINDSFVIDSSYNAEPSSMKAAISTLKDFPEGKRRIAIVGDMLELGLLEESSHREIGRYLRESMIDLVFFVGPKMKWAMDEMNSSVRDFRRVSFHFSDSFDAAKNIAQKIKKEDVILVKGSRGMLMERVVRRLSKS